MKRKTTHGHRSESQPAKSINVLGVKPADVDEFEEAQSTTATAVAEPPSSDEDQSEEDVDSAAKYEPHHYSGRDLEHPDDDGQAAFEQWQDEVATEKAEAAKQEAEMAEIEREARAILEAEEVSPPAPETEVEPAIPEDVVPRRRRRISEITEQSVAVLRRSAQDAAVTARAAAQATVPAAKTFVTHIEGYNWLNLLAWIVAFAVPALLTAAYHFGYLSTAALCAGWAGYLLAGRLIARSVFRTAESYKSGKLWGKVIVIGGIGALLWLTTGMVWEGMVGGLLLALIADRLLGRSRAG